MKWFMSSKTIVLACCASKLWLSTAFGFSSDTTSLTRQLNQTLSLTNYPIVVTVTFTNATLNQLGGFFYADQIPSGLVVETYSVTLNGKGITNYIFEAGMDGDVYPGCIPYRWILEQPPGLSQSNRIPAYSRVEMIYSINSQTGGTFTLSEFSWTGYQPNNSNISFGYGETTEQQTVRFVTSATPAVLSGKQFTNAFLLELAGTPEFSYVIEASTNLLNWTSIRTNIAPFEYLETNTAWPGRRFFRARQLH
jgi:hypothetical protein